MAAHGVGGFLHVGNRRIHAVAVAAAPSFHPIVVADGAFADLLMQFVVEMDFPHPRRAAGAYGGKVRDTAGVQALASIPSRDELLAKLLGVMQAPVSGFAVALGALAKQREEAAA
mgnify:CR=1 FL=1